MQCWQRSEQITVDKVQVSSGTFSSFQVNEEQFLDILESCKKSKLLLLPTLLTFNSSHCVSLSRSAAYITNMEDRVALSNSSRDPGRALRGGPRRGILSRAGTTQRLLPGKLHSRITRCINRPAGNEASGGKRHRGDKTGTARGHRVSCAQSG